MVRVSRTDAKVRLRICRREAEATPSAGTADWADPAGMTIFSALRACFSSRRLSSACTTSSKDRTCSGFDRPKLGDVPTKVRKTPRDLAQTRIYTTRRGFLGLPKSDCFQAANFGGLIPTESWSFSSEKSYSPSRLICCQDTTEPFAIAWNRISRASGPMTSLIFWDK